MKRSNDPSVSRNPSHRIFPDNALRNNHMEVRCHDDLQHLEIRLGAEEAPGYLEAHRFRVADGVTEYRKDQNLVWTVSDLGGKRTRALQYPGRSDAAVRCVAPDL